METPIDYDSIVTMDLNGVDIVAKALGWKRVTNYTGGIPYYRVQGRARGDFWEVQPSEVLSALNFPLEEAPLALASALVPGNAYYSSPSVLTTQEARARYEQVYVPIIEFRMQHGIT